MPTLPRTRGRLRTIRRPQRLVHVSMLSRPGALVGDFFVMHRFPSMTGWSGQVFCSKGGRADRVNDGHHDVNLDLREDRLSQASFVHHRLNWGNSAQGAAEAGWTATPGGGVQQVRLVRVAQEHDDRSGSRWAMAPHDVGLTFVAAGTA